MWLVSLRGYILHLSLNSHMWLVATGSDSAGIGLWCELCLSSQKAEQPLVQDPFLWQERSLILCFSLYLPRVMCLWPHLILFS